MGGGSEGFLRVDAGGEIGEGFIAFILRRWVEGWCFHAGRQLTRLLSMWERNAWWLVGGKEPKRN